MLNELRDYTNFSKIDSMSPEEIHEWYYIIKNSLNKLSSVYSTDEMNRIKNAIKEYEQRHRLS